MNFGFLSSNGGTARANLALGRLSGLLQSVARELENLPPCLADMHEQVVTALGETEQGVLAVITRINEIHALSCEQVERIQESMTQYRNLSEVIRMQGEQNERMVAIVLEEVHKHSDELSHGTQRTQALAAEVEELQGMVNLIRDIANQTNLLALNAAIEAAHAGPAGAGFAVVANEVKNLSTRSAMAVDEITHKFEALSRSMAAELAESDQVAAAVRESNQTLKQIIKDLGALEQQFSAASNEMQAIIGNVQGINNQVVARLVQALGNLQFQDVVQQRLQRVDRTLLGLDQHAQLMARNLQDDGWDGTFSPALQDRLEQPQVRFSAGQPNSAGSQGPAIELF
jgi:methyl-accepting chemotaxis protein